LNDASGGPLLLEISRPPDGLPVTSFSEFLKGTTLLYCTRNSLKWIELHDWRRQIDLYNFCRKQRWQNAPDAESFGGWWDHSITKWFWSTLEYWCDPRPLSNSCW